MAYRIFKQASEKVDVTKENFRTGFVAGMGWSFGVTVGFVIISAFVAFVLSRLGGLPLIGTWIASVVEEVQTQLNYSRFIN